MKEPAQILLSTNKFAASPLLSQLPVLHPAANGAATISATLNPAGGDFAFAHGRSALLHQLRSDCIAAADPAREALVDWRFTDPAQNTEFDRDDADLQNRRPTLPDVIGRDGQRGAIQALYLSIPASLSWFDGHFPADPILPAVVQIGWVMHFGSHCHPGDHSDSDQRRFAGMNRLKFRQVIVPDTVLRLTLESADGELQFRYESRDGLHSKGTIRFDCSDGDGDDQ